VPRQFNNHLRFLQRQGLKHGLSEVTRAGGDRTNGMEVGQGFHGKRRKVYFRKGHI
jgi:hypothetical protein